MPECSLCKKLTLSPLNTRRVYAKHNQVAHVVKVCRSCEKALYTLNNMGLLVVKT